MQLPIVILEKSIPLDMHHHKTYMYINFQQNWVSRSVKTVHTNLFAKIANCINLQLAIRIFLKITPFGHSAKFEINRHVRYQITITVKRKYFHRRTDGQTTIGIFWEKIKKILKTVTVEYSVFLVVFVTRGAASVLPQDI